MRFAQSRRRGSLPHGAGAPASAPCRFAVEAQTASRSSVGAWSRRSFRRWSFGVVDRWLFLMHLWLRFDALGWLLVDALLTFLSTFWLLPFSFSPPLLPWRWIVFEAVWRGKKAKRRKPLAPSWLGFRRGARFGLGRQTLAFEKILQVAREQLVAFGVEMHGVGAQGFVGQAFAVAVREQRRARFLGDAAVHRMV